MKSFNVYVVKDDYDQATVCVIDGAPSEDDAIAFATKHFPDDIDGDLYAYQAPMVEYTED